ncbi:glycoside-pentoside-hexuronide (GPH):cation symporter [Demequina sp. NBRC 110054]|uniref:glycoside-pentoside-hexuronide (GPH):cation symporter n=1 Tax=Demequina sp. NBRC 110054 TaxID=1570343 RepID=UPI0013563EC2|nr:glycoside-pentoside-hexuronide (GPH):cation symporter [Demequina sp. NBRC 110054]
MIGWRTKLAYGWGSLGNNIVYGFVATYLAVYYTEVVGIAAASASVLFFVVRIVDATADPVMGMIVDRTHTRWGRFRPYLLFTPPVLAVLTILAFSIPSLNTTATLVLAYVSYLLWGLSFTVMDVPYWSMSAALTSDARDRTSLVMVPRTLANVGYIGVNIITLPLVALFSFSGERQGWQIVAVLYAVTAMALTWVTFAKVKERAEAPASHRYSLPEMGRLFVQNKPLLLLLGAMFLTEVAFTMRNIIPVYYLTYNYDAADMVPMLVGVFAVTTLAGSLLSPVLAGRWGKRNAVFVGIAITSASSVGAWLNGYGSLTPIIGWIAITGLGYGITNISLVSMLTDTVEYGQWRTGRRTEGLVFSSNIFKTKVSSGVGASFALALLAAFGYVANQDQSVATLDGLHSTMTIIPGIVGILALVPLLWYRLDEGRHAAIVAELEARDAEPEAVS